MSLWIQKEVRQTSLCEQHPETPEITSEVTLRPQAAARETVT